VLEAFRHEELAGRVENGSAHGFTVTLLSFFDSHDVLRLGEQCSPD
jgi:hypothetical protein